MGVGLNGAGFARIVDEYAFRETGRSVVNEIESKFRFRNDMILEHQDKCDPRAWAAMAVGGVKGFVTGRLRFVRKGAARKKLDDFKLSLVASMPAVASRSRKIR